MKHRTYNKRHMKKPNKKENFHSILKKKADEYAFTVYIASKKFPKEEQYGITSQLRRSALSVVLNYIEGYARVGDKQFKNFLQIAYGSLKESKYLLFFVRREKFINEKEYNTLINLAEEIGAMLWTTINGLRQKK